ncbi:MAG: nucleotide exchange factor GrpE [Synergistaceae bacterium]
MTKKEKKEPIVEEKVTEAEQTQPEEIKQEINGNDELLKKIEEIETKLKEATEEAARARADYYNLRTRVERDREKDKKLAAERAVDLLLPVYENLERVCEAVEDRESNLYKGVSMVTKQFFGAMTTLGLEEISAEGAFDPSCHEAIMMQETDEEEKDGKIVDVFRKGYKLAGRVIRASQVRVGNYIKK